MSPQAQPKTRNISDADLLAGIARQQMTDFSELYDRYADRLFGLAIKILQNRTQAEDVIQDVFTNVWKKAATYRPQRGNVLGWLMIMCRNRCIDLKRSGQTQRQYFGGEESQLDQLSRSGDKDPLEQTSDRQKSTIVQSALNQLPREQRELIEMSYFGGYSQSEIAGQLELPLGTIKTRMRLAMQKLRDHFIEAVDNKKK